MLATIRGEPTDRLPFSPRMQLWYVGQQARGTLPRRFAGLNMAELANALGVACYTVHADPTIQRVPADEFALRALLGNVNHVDYPYRCEIKGLPVTFRQEGELYYTTIRTQAGDVTTVMEFTEAMARSGISAPHVIKFPIASLDDLERVAQVFEHVEVIPTPEAYAAFRRRVGEQGIAVAHAGRGAASPMQHILHDLMPQVEFFYMYADERKALTAFAKRMEPFFERVLDAVLACEAEVIYWGSNYDQDITPPTFFQEEIAPWLKRVSARMHAAGKFMLCHADGENHRLLPYYPPCGFDIAESVCPKPMTHCTLKELREGMGPRVTVWGGLCSTAFLKDSMSDEEFEAYLDKTFGELGTGERLIFGVSDMVPTDADLGRIERVNERIEAFGPVSPSSTLRVQPA